MSDNPIKMRAGKYINVYLGVIGAILLFGGGVLTGQAIYVRKNVVGENGQVSIDKVININRNTTRDSVEFSEFWDVWDEVKSKYVKQPVKDTDLFYGALQGMVAGLGDPYTMYFPPAAAQEFSKSLSGEFSGIGAEIGVKKEQLVVVAPLPGTPAMRAGLKPGDRILAIDKLSTLGMDVNTAVEHIRGVAGTSVVLTIAKEGTNKTSEVSITREKINVPSVTFEMKPGNIGYFRIMQFNDNTIPDFDKYISKQIQGKKVSGIILDLRNNPGGYLDGAVSMASEWVADGKIVSEKFSDGKTNDHMTIGQHRLSGIKTVVLINKGSASASEIVSGALKDHKDATLIGETSFGKGSVQDFQVLPDGSALKVTVAEWYTPAGNNINEKGIAPDIEFKEDFSTEKVGEDKMVDRAIEFLNTGK